MLTLVTAWLLYAVQRCNGMAQTGGNVITGNANAGHGFVQQRIIPESYQVKDGHDYIYPS